MNAFRNLAVLTDAYKVSHYKLYPKDTAYMNFYFESRGGRWNRTMFFGLQYFLKTFLSNPVTHEDVTFAKSFWNGMNLDFFNEDGWRYIVDKHGGYLPVEIEAVKEGTIVPVSNVLFQVKNTDPKCFWVPGWLETTISQTWYPITVATLSLVCKKIILDALEKSGTPETIPFRLHDFGFRGSSSIETAGIGGMSHLMNFLGTDTSIGSVFAQLYYGADNPAKSIPATEHSVITSWGRENEKEVYDHVIKTYLKPGSIVACVSDSYDIYEAVEHIWGEVLKNKIENSQGTIVIRPDSGNPVSVSCTVINKLMDKFGYTVNSKGYKVLPDYVRVIQGDGVNENSIKDILFEMDIQKLSADNISFGMGSCLLQNLNRDTLMFAMKCSSYQTSSGSKKDVFKCPITDTTKVSKRGELALIESQGAWRSVRKETIESSGFENLLQPVWRNGELLKEYNFDNIRNI